MEATEDLAFSLSYAADKIKKMIFVKLDQKSVDLVLYIETEDRSVNMALVRIAIKS